MDNNTSGNRNCIRFIVANCGETKPVQERCFDLVAAVISVSTDRILKKAEIIIGDDSLERHQCARVQLWKLTDKDLDECIAIQKGDIIRFHAVCVRKKYVDSSHADDITIMRNNLKPFEQKLSSCVCDFYLPLKSYTALSPFVQVGYVCGRHIMTKGNHIGELSSEPSVVNQVGAWFREIHGSSTHNDDSTRLHTKRRLCELITPNMKSDVIVRVLHMDIDGKTKRHSVGGRYGNIVEYARIILVDGEEVERGDDSMALHILYNSPLFLKISECYKKQEAFILRNVLTQKAHHVKSTCMNSNELIQAVILVPTYKSTIEVLPHIHLNNNSKRRRTNELKGNQHLDGPPTLSTLSTHGALENTHSSVHHVNEFKMVGHLSSLRFNGMDGFVCSMTGWSEYLDFFSNVVGKWTFQELSGKTVILTICPKECNVEDFQVVAGTDIIATLCGCSDLSESLNQNEVISEEHSTFLKNLISLKVPLEWSLKHSLILNTTYAEAVSLPTLDF